MSTGARAILSAAGRGPVSRQLKKLPVGIVAQTLNQPTISQPRRKMHEEYVFHVSDVMSSEPTRIFCPRQAVLEYFEGHTHRHSALTAGKDLLFATGHMFHEHVVTKFIERSTLRKYIYGQWSCHCKKVMYTGYGQFGKRSPKCTNCNTKADKYNEYSLYWPNYRIVGHPDILFLVNNILYIYEIKTIDRRDLTVNNITAPVGDHLVQASFYYYMARNEGFKVARNIRFLYVDRSARSIFEMMPYKELTAPALPPDVIGDYLNKPRVVMESIESKTLPPGVCRDQQSARAKACGVCVSCFSRKSSKITRATETQGK